MTGNMSRVSGFVKILSATAVASCAVLAPTMSYAQSDQTIVLNCQFQPDGGTLTLDLAAKTVVEDSFDHFTSQEQIVHGTITQVSDGQIAYLRGTDGEIGTLDRYTGHLKWTDANGNPLVTPWINCQKQQKQF